MAHVALALALLLARPALAEWRPADAAARAYNRGVEALTAADPADAETWLRRALEQDPSCGLCRDALAIALYRQARLGEAEAEALAVTGAWADQGHPWVTLSLIRFARQDFTGSREAAEHAVRMDPTSVEAQASLVEVLLRQGDVTAARAALDAAEGQLGDPERACLAVQVWAEAGDPARAQVHARTCRASTVRELVAAALLLVADDEASLAMRENVSRRAGADATAQVAQAIDRMNNGDWATARSLLDQALAASAEDLYARMLRARCLYELGLLDLARADLERVVSGHTWVEVHQSGALTGVLRHSQAERLGRLAEESAGVLVRILLQQGDPEGAARRLAQAREQLGPVAPLASAEIDLALARGDRDSAWAAVDRAAQAWPADRLVLDTAGRLAIDEPGRLADHPAVARALGASGSWSDRFNLAVAYAANGQFGPCLATADEAAPLTPDEGIVGLRQLGYRCAVGVGDLERAQAILPRVLADDPAAGLHAARLNHAIMLFQADRFAEALAMVEAIEPADPVQRELQVALGLKCSVRLGDLDGAIRWAAHPEADPQDLAWLGSRLAREGRDADAAAILGRACAGLEGNGAADCESIRAGVGE